MTNYIAATLGAAMGKFVGQLQSRRPTDKTRAAAKATADAFFQALLDQGMIDDFQNVCDLTNNPIPRIALGYMQLDCQVVFLAVVEYFIINLQGGQSVIINRLSTQPTSTFGIAELIAHQRGVGRGRGRMTSRFVCGDCREVLARLPADSVHCVVTSPPYWGLRDYGIPPTVWGGDAKCEHLWGKWQEIREIREEINSGKSRTTDRFYGEPSRKFNGNHQKITAGCFCRRCGAWRGAHGLEPTIDLYVRNAVEVFRAVRRVLRPDGTLWLNLGDSYATRWSSQRREGRGGLAENVRKRHGPAPHGLKSKDLCGIPWRVAFALQADGWWLRQDIIWAKPNPMPESVTDRCTKSHEYLFLLSKGPRYFYDAEAIKEDASSFGRQHTSGIQSPKTVALKEAGLHGEGGDLGLNYERDARNKRSVWTVATSPFKAAHFATFPPKLIEPCIKAGCPKGGTVLDPFGGAGTTGLVADRLHRDSILIELGAKYVAMARRRIAADRKPKITARPRRNIHTVPRPAAPPQLRIAACRRRA
jgi:DNA modification methylase